MSFAINVVCISITTVTNNRYKTEQIKWLYMEAFKINTLQLHCPLLWSGDTDRLPRASHWLPTINTISIHAFIKTTNVTNK